MRRLRYPIPYWLIALLVLMTAAALLTTLTIFTPAFPEVRKWLRLPMSEGEKLTVTYQILRNERMSFLVSQKQEWRAQFSSERSLGLGVERTISAITADVFYGYDLNKLTPECLSVEKDGTVVIRFPEPEILTVALKPETLEAITKREGFAHFMWDFEDRDMALSRRLSVIELEFMQDLRKNQALPFSEIESGVLAFIKPLLDKSGVPFRLEFTQASSNQMINQYIRDHRLSYDGVRR